MFAHQVIDKLNESKTKNNFFEQNILNSIKQSQKFHFGSMDELNEMVKLDENKNLFSYQEQPIKLPYDNCWFDYTIDSGKFAVGFLIDVQFGHILPYSGEIENDDEYYYSFDSLMFVRSPVHGWMLCSKGARVRISTETRCGKISICPLINHPMLWDGQANVIPAYLSNIEKTVRLLNCKNIQTEKIQAPAKLNKKRVKSGKQPIFDYHVLNLVLPSNKKRGYQEQTTPLSHNRVHLCRGHFKEYTKEHPLFGRHTGLYWWEPSVRGQNRDGVVMKDYNIKAKNYA